MNLMDVPTGNLGVSQAAHTACATAHSTYWACSLGHGTLRTSRKEREPLMSWSSSSVFGGGWEGFPWQKGISKALKEVSVK